MPDKSKKLSDTARALLTSAAMRDDHLIHLPRLPVAAARQVIRSLLNGGLAEEVPAPIDDAGYVWRTGEDGGVLMLRATMLGLARVAADEGCSPEPVSVGTVVEVAAQRLATIGTNAEGAVTAVTAATVDLPANVGLPSQDAQGAPEDANRGGTAPASVCPAGPPEATLTGSGRVRRANTLRLAAQAVLHAWDRRADGNHEIVEVMNGPFAALRAALAARASVSASIDASRPSKGTKHAQVVSMLSRDEGASGPQIAHAMGWAPHTVRGFLAGLAKKGITVDVLDRVRQIGPNKTGAKGSYTVYRIADRAGA
jgi:hypothetical protein